MCKGFQANDKIAYWYEPNDPFPNHECVARCIEYVQSQVLLQPLTTATDAASISNASQT